MLLTMCIIDRLLFIQKNLVTNYAISATPIGKIPIERSLGTDFDKLHDLINGSFKCTLVKFDLAFYVYKCLYAPIIRIGLL